VLGRGGDGVEAAGVLIGLERTVALGAVVENLYLDSSAVAVVGAVFRYADIDAAVAAGSQLIFEPEIEVVELLLAAEPGSFFAGADDRADLDLPAFFCGLTGAFPAGEGLAVKQGTLAGRVGGERCCLKRDS